MEHTELLSSPRWSRTGNAFFPVAAVVDGAWWVLRLNSFPDHPLWTLFVDGRRRFDVDDTPAAWGAVGTSSAPVLPARDVRRALAPVQGYVAYGSEVGRPCDNVFCCGPLIDRRTDGYDGRRVL